MEDLPIIIGGILVICSLIHIGIIHILYLDFYLSYDTFDKQFKYNITTMGATAVVILILAVIKVLTS